MHASIPGPHDRSGILCAWWLALALPLAGCTEQGGAAPVQSAPPIEGAAAAGASKLDGADAQNTEGAVPGAAQDAVVRLELLRSPNFQPVRGAQPTLPLAWWRSSGGHALCAPEGGLRIIAGQWAEQPVAFPREHGAGLELHLTLFGEGQLRLRDGGGREGVLQLGAAGEESSHALAYTDLAEVLGGEPVPRLVVRLEGVDEVGAVWRRASCELPLPCPSPGALRQKLVDEVAWVIGLYREQGADVRGPQRTAFVANYFDVVTGERLYPLPGRHSAIADLYLDAARCGVPGASEANLAMVTDLLLLGFSPETGLPWMIDCDKDVPKGQTPLEPHKTLEFLIDVARDGAPGLSAELCVQAHSAARRLAAACLAKGTLPDGQLSAKYVPGTGQPSTSYPALRRLDMPAQIASIARFDGLDEPPIAVVDAVAHLLYTHTWVGDWDEIDPGFDDNYGHYGGRGVVLWGAYPEVSMFRDLAMGGWDYYAPRWRDTLRFGGNVAADQVRCWRIFAEAARLEPTIVEPLGMLLHDALVMHWKGQQYDGGAWGDVTVKRFDPKGNLQVGDIKGLPQNMLNGMAVLYDRRFAETSYGMGLPEQRARIDAVLDSTRRHYRRPFGYLSTRTQVAGDNPCGGELGLAAGLVEILLAMDRAHPELAPQR